jgi:hypothetical protein
MQYAQMAKVTNSPVAEMARLLDGEYTKATIGSYVYRCRKWGLLTTLEHPKIGSPDVYTRVEVTPKCLAILKKARHRAKAIVSFSVDVHAHSKEEALAELWDLVMQVEHWDPRDGKAFKIKAKRLQKLGSET